jgi:SAM-dependent methyltransferase
MTPNDEVTYPLDRSAQETRRLEHQAQLYEPLNQQLFAMIEPGMKVLDVGCGGGEFTLRAARAIGPTGQVVGVDVSPVVLDVARDRIAQAGLTNVSFVQSDLRSADVANDFDAVIGGRVLLYTPDPDEALRASVSHVRAGGLVAFQDMQYAPVLEYAASHPLPLWGKTVKWFQEAFESSGTHLDTGFGLHSSFIDLGFAPVEMGAYSPMGGPRGWMGFDFIAESFSSFGPMFEKLGMTEAAAQDLGSLASRLADEVEQARCPIQLFTFVNLWGRKP